MAFIAVLADSEPDVEPVRSIAELSQHVPEGQGILAPADRHQNPSGLIEHRVVGDSALHLSNAELLEMGGTKVGVVPWEVDDRRLTARSTLRHSAP